MTILGWFWILAGLKHTSHQEGKLRDLSMGESTDVSNLRTAHGARDSRVASYPMLGYWLTIPTLWSRQNGWIIFYLISITSQEPSRFWMRIQLQSWSLFLSGNIGRTMPAIHIAPTAKSLPVPMAPIYNFYVHKQQDASTHQDGLTGPMSYDIWQKMAVRNLSILGLTGFWSACTKILPLRTEYHYWQW